MFKNKEEFADTIKEMGGELFLVGGAVRDSLLLKTPHDEDFMITGLSVDEVPFEKVVGADFPVFLVEIAGVSCEIAMARKERKVATGHKGFKFSTDKSITVVEDLKRRDLTINAMAVNLNTGEFLDPFNGEEDLKNGILRHTSNAFSEDPLRVFRVARFAAKLNFTITNGTKELMRKLAPELETLPVERIWEELAKTLKTRTPSRFFEVLMEVDCLEVFFAEVAALNVPDKHDGTAFNHTMTVMNSGFDPLERFGLLCHDFGKGCTPAEDHPSHFGHDKLGIEPVIALCDRIRVPNKFKKVGLLCATMHMRMKRATDMKPGKFLRLVLDNKDHFDMMLTLSFLDSVHRDGGSVEEILDWFERASKQAKIVKQVEHEITGKHLIAEGKKPGPHFGMQLLDRRIKLFKHRRK